MRFFTDNADYLRAARDSGHRHNCECRICAPFLYDRRCENSITLPGDDTCERAVICGAPAELHGDSYLCAECAERMKQ